MLTNQQKMMIFVDEANFRKTAETKEISPDLIKLRSYLAGLDKERDIMEMVVYIGHPPQKKDMCQSWQEEYNAIYKRADKFKYNGMIVVKWEGKVTSSWEYPNGDPGYTANVDMIMAMDAFEFAVEAKPDIVVLVTGDGDFAYLAEKLRRQGIRVEAASTNEQASQKLKRSVNSFIDLTDFFNDLAGHSEPIGFPDLDLAAVLDNDS